MGISMKNSTIQWAMAFILLFSSCAIQAQPAGKPKTDERTRDLVSLARKYYRTQQWLDAALTYELATQRPYNQLTSYSVFMAGLSFYKLEEKEKAMGRFKELLSKYPKSKYAEEAQYHKALILLESTHTSDREKGLDEMFALHKKTGNSDLRDEAEKSVRHFLFEVYPEDVLDLYSVFADDAYKSWFTEAHCYKLDQKGDGTGLLAKIAAHETLNGQMTNYMAQLKEKYEYGHPTTPNRLKIAIFLSFHLEAMDTATVVPDMSRKAMEMIEGMMVALDSTGDKMEKQILVTIFDTKGNPDTLKGQLDSLERFGPDVIVGDIRSSLALPLSKWAESHQVLHFIPRNPFSKLVNQKRYTFLTHPALENHGEQMAKYAYHQEGLRRFVVFNDQTPVSAEFSKAFKAALDSMPGATVTVKEISRTYEENRKTVPKYVKTLKTAGYDAAYIPLSSEEAAGLIISQLNYHKVDLPVLGGPDWEIFSVIDPELKSAYNLRYSSFYHEKNDSLTFDKLSETCLRNYGSVPSQYTVQGYDIMAYVLHASTFLNPFNDAGEVVRNLPSFRGIHQDFCYEGRQSNQKINVIQFQDGRTRKVNWDREESELVPDGEQGDPGGR